jgi:hypothetical protein
MGKKAKEHRKKVQRRNETLKVQHKKAIAELQNQFQAQMAERQKSMQSPIPQQGYASTGDYVAKNYEEIFKKGGQHAAQSLIETTDEGPRFS